MSPRRMALGAALFIIVSTTRATAADDAPPPEPAGPPPPMRVSDSSWNASEPERDADEGDAQAAPNLHRNLAIGAQWFFLQDKLMPGLTLRGGHKWIWVHAETSLAFTTESAPGLDSSVLGSQFGAYFALSPLNRERVELDAAIGGDFYWLWQIHGDLWEVALSTRVSGHFWVSRQLGAFATARAYPVSTRGLELGTNRAGEAGLPILFSIGAEWRPR